ncbi:MAG: class I SAM-dependent methyltransferase [Deltaproteobacteria bacterium]
MLFSRAMPARERFDEAYYRRHYRGPDRVHSASQVGRLASGVAGLADWLGVDLRAVLEVGAGPGFWRAWFRRHRPAVRYVSTDASPFACKRYGHLLRDVSAWRPRGRFDLVVCQGVLQYLDDARAGRAIANLAAASRGLLYLEAVTRHDLDEVLDAERSDTEIHARTGDWYRAALDPHFVQVGAGLWAVRSAGIPLYELEGAPVHSRLRRQSSAARAGSQAARLGRKGLQES